MRYLGVCVCVSTVLILLPEVTGRLCTIGGSPLLPVVKRCTYGCCGERFDGRCCPKTDVDGIVGGVLGGVVLLSIMVALVCWYQQRHRQQQTIEPYDDDNSDVHAIHDQSDDVMASQGYMNYAENQSTMEQTEQPKERYTEGSMERCEYRSERSKSRIEHSGSFMDFSKQSRKTKTLTPTPSYKENKDISVENTSTFNSLC